MPARRTLARAAVRRGPSPPELLDRSRIGAAAIVRDAVDVRDLAYRPALSLLPESFMSAALDPADPSGAAARFDVRDQGETNTCVGQALAAVVDIQRFEALRKRAGSTDQLASVQPASARMLYAMALAAQGPGGNSAQAGAGAGITSLRSGLKGFYNAGVCTEALWLQQAGADALTFDMANVTVMKQARNVTLGAYYRVMPVINDYHAAVVEAGALYVSAEIHPGWDHPEKNAGPDRGRIVYGAEGGSSGGGAEPRGHAFVIVGYTREGFLVLNSWGRGWGCYRPPGATADLPGVALWPYEDWAGSVLDAWVLRLAVPTPDAFRFTIGAHGLASFGDGADRKLAAPPIRRLDVIGNYAHLDDGHHVATGVFPSSWRNFEATLTHLRTHGEEGGALKYDHILLVLHGDIAETQAVLARTAKALANDRAARIFRFSLVWINDLLNGAAQALQPLFGAAHALSKGNSADADRRIEEMTRPVGRAVWRDARHAAGVAAGTSGDATTIFNAFCALCAETGRTLHLVSEGAGALLLSQLIAGARREPACLDMLGSVSLVAPLIPLTEFNELVRPALAGTGAPLTIFRPDAEFNRRLKVGLYSRSWLELVEKAFEEAPPPLLGAPVVTTRTLRGLKVVPLAPPAAGAGEARPTELALADLFDHPRIGAVIRDAITRRSGRETMAGASPPKPASAM